MQDGRQTLFGAALVAVAVVVGSLVVAGSLNRMTAQLDRATGRLDELQRAVADAKDALGNLGRGAPQPVARRGPDPDRRYTLKTEGAPVLGPQTAKVKVVEFSDFQ